MDLKKLKDAREYARTWLERSQQVSEAAPRVRETLEVLDWEIRTLESRPLEAYKISASALDEHADRMFSQLTSSLPMIPAIDTGRLNNASSVTASSSYAMVTYLAAVSELPVAGAVQYASGALTEYKQLQTARALPEQLRMLLVSKLPAVVPKFDLARRVYEQFGAGHGLATAAAIEMQTFLDGLKGELFQRARRHPQENMTMDTVLERLYSSSPASPEVTNQFRERSSLYDVLSTVAKRRDVSAPLDVDALWARVLNHAFIIVSGLQ